MIEDAYTHARAWAKIHATQRHLEDHLLRPLIAAAVEDAYTQGLLPLPPLQLGRADGWMRGEVWYLGDLR